MGGSGFASLGPEAGDFLPLLQISLLPVTPEMYSFKEQAEQGFHTDNTHLHQPYTVVTVVTTNQANRGILQADYQSITFYYADREGVR